MRKPSNKQKKPLGVPKDSHEKAEKYEKDLDNLWAIIRSAPQIEREEIVKQLDEDTIIALRTRQNPYKKPVFMQGKNKALAFGIINVTEKDAQRFAMTSLIGFIYRMLDEYKPEGLDNYTSENDAKFAIPFNQKIKEIRRKKPEEILMKQLIEVKEQLKTISPEENSVKYKEIARESYVVRTKILKNRIFWSREDYNVITEKKERLQRDVQSSEEKEKELLKSIGDLKSKMEKKKKFEEDQVAKAKAIRDNPGLSTNPIEISESNIPEGITVEDLRKKTANYIIEIENKEKLIVKEKEKREELIKEKELREKQYAIINERLKDFNNQFKELKVDFLKRTGRSKLAADLIKEQKIAPTSVRKRNNKKKTNKKDIHTELDDVIVDKYELDEKDYDSAAEIVKKELGIDKTAEEYTIEMQNMIEKFLDEYFRYNPDNHVRCAYKPNYEDPQRVPLEKNKKEDEESKNYERTVIPPDDTFFRWRRYAENNYECLRQATDDIYCEKFDFEFALVPLQEFEGDSKDDVERKFDLFKRKHANEFDSEIFSATYGIWNLLASWEQNREVRDFYTEKTEIIKRIIDQHKSDERMGISLMKDRAKKKKGENEAKEGPHDPSLHQYRKAMRPNDKLERHGAKHMDELDEGNNELDWIEGSEHRPEQIPRDDDESTNQEIEVGVHIIKPYIGGGRRRIPRGVSESWKFHVNAEELPEGSINVMSGPEFQQKNEDMINDLSI
jgi:hypothetical protein